MKPSIKIITCVVFLSILFTAPFAKAQADKLIGVWKVTEITSGGSEEPKTTNIKSSALVFTKKYMVSVVDMSEKPRPVLSEEATDAQKVAVWEPFDASAYTYEVEGNALRLLRTIVAKNPSKMPGLSVKVYYKFEGDTLVITPNAPGDDFSSEQFTIKCTRLE